MLRSSSPPRKGRHQHIRSCPLSSARCDPRPLRGRDATRRSAACTHGLSSCDPRPLRGRDATLPEQEPQHSAQGVSENLWITALYDSDVCAEPPVRGLCSCGPELLPDDGTWHGRWSLAPNLDYLCEDASRYLIHAHAVVLYDRVFYALHEGHELGGFAAQLED